MAIHYQRILRLDSDYQIIQYEQRNFSQVKKVAIRSVNNRKHYNICIQEMKILIWAVICLVEVFSEFSAKAKETVHRKELVVQGDHFYSKKDRTANYTLKDLELNKPVVIILKGKNEKDSDYTAKLNDQVNITISDDQSQSVSCTFRRLNDLCKLQNVKSKSKTSVKLTCQSSPCDITFQAFQPTVQNTTVNKSVPITPFALYSLKNPNLMIQIKKYDPTNKEFAYQLRFYSSADMELFDLDNFVIIVFKKQVQDFIFMVDDERVLKHIKLKVRINADSTGFGITEQAFVLGKRQINITKKHEKGFKLEVIAVSVYNRQLQQINVTIFGLDKDQKKKEIAKFQTDLWKGEVFFHFNIVLQKYKIEPFHNLSFLFYSKENFMTIFQVTDNEVHQLNVSQYTYFTLEKGENMTYNIVPDPDADKKLGIRVDFVTKISGDTNKLNTSFSETPCYYYKGCKLTLSAAVKISAGLSVRQVPIDSDGDTQPHYEQISKSQTLDIMEGSRSFLRHEKPANNTIISVNSANVIMYAAIGQRCFKPSAKCFDYAGNSQSPITIQGAKKPIYITVQALQTVRVTVRVDDSDSDFQLIDEKPLIVKMGNSSVRYFKFKPQLKATVYFNLIGPLNSFVMTVSNSDKKPEEGDVDLPTGSSFIKIEKNAIDKPVFTIAVKRLNDKQNEQFTIIASSKNSIITLDRAQPHYDLIDKDQSKQFAVLIPESDIDDKIQTILNIDVFQNTEKLNLTVKFGFHRDKFTKFVTVKKSPTAINLNRYAQTICKEQDEQGYDYCTMFILITNNNSETLDVTLSLLENNSIITLKSGVWQRYQLTELTSQNHFIYTPSNLKYPINLQFIHNFGVYKLAYTLWNNKLKQRDAGKWPFPQPVRLDSSQGHLGLIQGNEYVINPEQIKKCYPDCILLISLIGENKGGGHSFGFYSIMASDSVMELVEDHKVSITLGKNESRYLLIDIDQFVKSEKTLTIFESNLLGFHVSYAKLVSNRQLKYPTDQQHDYRLDGYETQYNASELLDKIREKKMQNDKDISLIVYCKGFDTNRFTIQFTTRQNPILKLLMGMTQTLTLAPHSSKHVSVEHYLSFRVKIMRNTSYPLISYIVCNRSEMDTCYDKLENQNSTKLTDKTNEIREKCQSLCLLLIKVESEGDKVVVDFTALSQFSSVELKEGQIVTDVVSANNTNLYKVSAVKDQNVVITVTVFEGDPTVTVYNTIENINKTAKKKDNHITISVSPTEFKSRQAGQQHNTTMLTNFAFSRLLSQLMISVESKDENSSYSISYSMGQRSLILLDGVLSSASLKKDQTVIFNYHSYGKISSIVSLSFLDSDMMTSCDISYTSSIGDMQPIVTVPEKLIIPKKLPRPTLTFHLDDKYSDFEIIIKNTESKVSTFFIMINHADLVLLPFDYEYTSFVGTGEAENLIVEVANGGYVEFVIKKCSESDLNFSYALSDEAFQKEEWNYQTVLEQPTYEGFFRVNASSVYVRLSSVQGVLYSIKATHFYNKKDIPESDYKPGGKGLIQFVMISEKTVQITFEPVVCKGKCPNITYYYLLSDHQASVINQVSCTGNYFIFQPITAVAPQQIRFERSLSSKLRFRANITSEIEFLGIKAVLANGRIVAYPTIEIATFWGGVQKNYHFLLIISGLIVICMFYCVIHQFRRIKGPAMKYSTLHEQEQ